MSKQRKSKMNKSNNGLLFLMVVAILLIAGSVGFLAYKSSQQQSLTGGLVSNVDDDGNIVALSTCESTTTPDLTIKCYDTENVGTAVSEATNSYRKIGDISWTNFTVGTAIADLEVGADYEFVIGITTTDFTDNAYGSYFKLSEMIGFEAGVPCKPTFSINMPVGNDEIETSLTATFYNADGDASAETFSAGETQTISIKLKAGTDEFFGNQYIVESKLVQGNEGQTSEFPNLICLQLNASSMDKPEQVYLLDGTDLSVVSTPQRLTKTATSNNYCYELPVITDKETRVFIDLNADDTNAPAVDDIAYIFAGNFYIDAETGDVEFGVENEEGTAVGTDAGDSVAIDVTA